MLGYIIYIYIHLWFCAIELCLTNKSWNHPFWGVDPTHLHIGKKAIDHGLWEIWPTSASWRLHFQPDTIKPWDRAGEMPFTWPAKVPRSFRWFFRLSPTHQGTPISVRPVGNFGEATQMMTLLFHIADPFQDSYTFDPKLDEEEMERHNGPTKWPCTKVRDKNFSAHLQKLTHLEPFLPNGAMPLYLSLKAQSSSTWSAL